MSVATRAPDHDPPAAAPPPAEPSAGATLAVLALLDLDDVLAEIERCDQTASPLFADYALTLSAVVPFEHRHDKVPWVPVAGTASDGRDGKRLRAAALGTSAALDTALEAVSVEDEGLRAALERATEAAAAWGHCADGSCQARIEHFRGYFDPLIAHLGSRVAADEPIEARLIRGVGNVVHGAAVGERVLARPGDRNAATIAISSFAQAVHHAARAARSSGDGALDRVCEDAVHGLVAMAAVA